jgi:hypothetical protein
MVQAAPVLLPFKKVFSKRVPPDPDTYAEVGESYEDTEHTAKTTLKN